MRNSNSSRNKWRQLPCGVPGYAISAGRYADVIKDQAAKGNFGMAAYYIKAATDAGQLDRITFAATARLQVRR